MRRLATDAVIDERYQVLGHLGTGGMADVYCAHDMQLERKVALKLLHDRFAQDEEFVERFRREASSAAGLQHQHVVSVYDRGEYDGTPYIAMEYVDGRTLKQLVRDDGPLDPARAAKLTVQILRAARFAHRRGVIHRDFKPQNVIVDDEGRAKVTDFGIARAGPSDMTQTGSIMGTAQYLSPEQAQGHAVTARSDLYSIGIILYELLTGRVPFDAESAVTVALKQVSEAPYPPSKLNSAVTPELEAIVLNALAKDPADRFADADEFIAALDAGASRIPSASLIAAAEAVAASLPGSAPADAPPPAPPPRHDTAVIVPASDRSHAGPPIASLPIPPRRRRWPWMIVAAALGVVLLVAIVMAVAPDKVEVPKVVGATISVATQRLEDAGFEVAEVRDNSDAPRNTVVGQNPAGGESAEKGSRVTLNISDGPRLAKVPDVVGKARREARRLLTAASFVAEEKPTPSDSVASGRVIAQNPSGDSQAETGSRVTIEISTGPEQVAVPDVTGMSEEAARSALDRAGLRVSVVEKEDDEADAGTVLAQSPARGARAARGAVVTITVAEQSSQVTVPSVVGRSQNQATTTLSGAGLKVVVKEAPVDSPDDDGVVQAQDPGAGETVDRGASLTITVGVFDPDLNPDPTTTTPPPTTTTTTVPP